MTIDEAIARERQLAKEQRSHIGTWYSKIMGYDDEYIKKCEVCAEEHKQIAKWLEELKSYKEKPEGWMWDEAEQKGYNKAIDDAIDKISCGGKYNMSLVDELRKLKDGGENDD